MTTTNTATTTTTAREAAQRAALEAMLARWQANNPGGSIRRDVEIDEA